jgi:hypothetical protein
MYSSETLVSSHQTAWYRNPQSHTMNLNLRSYGILVCSLISCTEGLGFQFRLWDWLFWLRLFMVFVSFQPHSTVQLTNSKALLSRSYHSRTSWLSAWTAQSKNSLEADEEVLKSGSIQKERCTEVLPSQAQVTWQCDSSWHWVNIILSCVLVTIDGVRIGNWIYWSLTSRNYN